MNARFLVFLALLTPCMFAHDILLLPVTQGGQIRLVAKFGHPGDFQTPVIAKVIAKVAGLRLEIIPKANPFLLKPGDKLPVEVRFEGKPLSGAGVEIGDGVTAQKEAEITRYKTDANGVAMVPIGKTGLQVVAVDYNAPSKTPAVSTDDAYSSTLTFTLRP